MAFTERIYQANPAEISGGDQIKNQSNHSTMAAVIKSSASIKNVFQYNEHKLKQYAAQLIHSMNQGKDTSSWDLPITAGHSKSSLR